MFKKIGVIAAVALLSGCASMAELEKRSDGLSAYPGIKYEQFQGYEIVSSYTTTKATRPYNKLKMQSCLYDTVRNDIMVHTDAFNEIKDLEAGGRIVERARSNSAIFSGNFEQTITLRTIVGDTPYTQYVKYKGIALPSGDKTQFTFTGLSVKPKSGGEHPLWSRKTNSPEESIKELDKLADEIADCLNDE
ncbi:Uncharacterised protein [Escherichia coli]|uniref:hypothetical protein n=1 Tax=Escherichia coli TaxID=562 RepID=UPI0006A1C3FB|nr:hypothetical protein [Escherichia coli]MDA6633007.1 hypothetical protein [Escherichia coli]CTW11972.1 Uncharacterised protein [Escherichia coli]